MQLVQHVYDNKPSRCYINGCRVSFDYFHGAIARAQAKGRVLNSFHSSVKFDANGNAHRINRSCI